MWGLTFIHQKVWNHFSSSCISKKCTQYFRCQWRSLLSCSNTVWNFLLWMRSDWIRCSAFVQLFPWAGRFVFLSGRRAAWLLLNSAYYTGHRIVGKQCQVFLVCLCPLVCCVPFCAGSRRPCEEWQTIVPNRGSSGFVEYMLLRETFPPALLTVGVSGTTWFSGVLCTCAFIFLLGVDIYPETHFGLQVLNPILSSLTSVLRHLWAKCFQRARRKVMAHCLPPDRMSEALQGWLWERLGDVQNLWLCLKGPFGGWEVSRVPAPLVASDPLYLRDSWN